MKKKHYTLADVVGRLRKMKGDSVTIREFAPIMGISPEHLAQILRGERRPGPQVLRKLKLKKSDPVYEDAA